MDTRYHEQTAWKMRKRVMMEKWNTQFEIDKSFDSHSLSSFILYVFFESLDSSLLFTYFLSPSTPSSEAMLITSFSLSIFAS